MRVILLILCLSLWSEKGWSQFSDDFSDGNISASPEWLGDVSQFVVNSAGELQLMAPAAGSSYLYLPTSYPDSFSLSLQFRMTFAPSGTNYARIYFMLDNQNFNIANGYYINLGENGNLDAIRFYVLNAGVATLLASGTSGAIAADPVRANIRITRKSSGLFTLEAAYDDEVLLQEDVSFVDERHAPSIGNFFGIQCVYTSTRTDRFYFDNIRLSEYQPDLEGPILTSVDVLDQQSLRLRFNEAVELPNSDQFSVSDGIGAPSLVRYDGTIPNTLVLEFSSNFDAATAYVLEGRNIADVSGNISTVVQNFRFVKRPELGDLSINEVLSDPNAGGEDYIEIVNRSSGFVELQGLIIRNAGNGQSRTLTPSTVLGPGEYVAISRNIDFLRSNYNPIPTARLVANDLPAMNISSGNVTLQIQTNSGLVTLDSFNYDNKMHSSFLDITKGVSLERIDLSVPSDVRTNWTSASSRSNYGTPGYENSNKLQILNQEGFFNFVTKTFSPNGDGLEDEMRLRYELPKAGFIANLSIFSSDGFRLKHISQNELLGTTGFITWDGLDADGRKARVGIYVLSGQVFHPDGEVIPVKFATVLAEALD